MACIENSFLSEQIDLLDKILAASTDHIYVFDRAGQCWYASPAGLAALGRSAEEAIGKNWHELNVLADSMEGHDAQRDSVFQTGIPVRGEMRLSTMQGSRHYEYVISPIWEKDGVINTVTLTSRDITDRKQAEVERQQLQLALQEQETSYRQLFESNPQPMWVYDLETLRFLAVNPAAIAKYGYSESEFLSMTIADIRPADEVPRLLENVTKVEEGLDLAGIWHHRLKEGRLILVDIVSHTLEFSGRRAELVLAHDVTERQQAEAALQRNEEQLRLAFDFAQLGSWDWDLLTHQITWNQTHFRLLGLDPETVTASYENWRNRVHPDDVMQIEAAIQQALQTHTPYVGEYRVIRPDGSLCWVIGKGQAIYDESGQPTRMIGVLLDITDRKQAEATLQQREAILRLFAQYAPAGIAMFDREMRYVMASQRWADDYQLDSIDSLIGRSHYDIFPDVPDRWRQIHQRCLAGAIETCEEDLFVRANGTEQWIRWEVRPWHTADDIGGIIVFSEDITQRKQAEASVFTLNQELQQRVVELQTLLDVIPIGIGIAEDPDCRQIQVNPAFAQALNIPPAVNASLSAPEDERPTNFKVYQNGREMAIDELPLQYAAKHGVEVRDLEVEVVWQDGTAITLLEYAAPLLNEQGQPRGSVGAFLNISERKRAEADLQKYKDIFQFSEYGLATSRGISLELVNPAFAQMHGYTVEEMLNKPILELFPPEYHADTLAFIQRLDQAGHLSYESYHLRKDGSVFPILLDITVVRDEQNNLLYWIVTAFDITDRKRTEIALRESEARYRALIQNFPNGSVCLFDQDLRYVLAEGRGLAEVGLDRTQLEGQTIWDAFDPQTCQRIAPYYQAALAGQSHTAEIPFADRIYRVDFLPLYNEQGQVKLGMSMSQDITLQKQAEQVLTTARDELERQVQERTWELRQLAEELQRSNHELEQFAYVASHDLQEPLRAITSFTQLLAKRYRGQLDAKADTYIEFIVDGAIRMQQLVKALLTYSRVGRHEMSMQSVDCNALLERVKQDLQVAIAENRAVITASPLPTITADPTQMANLLQNLISNSLKYRSDADPQIHISAKKITETVDRVASQGGSPDSTTPGPAWLFSIQDNGIGIEPQYGERIFGIFQRLHTSDEYSGTGLGLAICRKIIERHEGQIWVESQLGQGATFCFTIPISMRAQNDDSRQITQDSAR